ncbi:MAG TPA: hypothetical protein VGR00_06445, partial [Thermoanaerobaculia bacterium]|nr:hypothetical protein [Thermoanaerobaculia bacterium]
MNDDAAPPTESRQPKRRRRALRLLGGLVVLLLFVAELLLVLSRSSIAHRALFDRAVTIVEEKTGGRLTARSVDIDLFEGLVVLKDLTWGAPAGPPVATARLLTIRFDARSLLRERRVVASTALDGLHLDLGAPMPRSRKEAAPTSPSDVTLAFVGFELTNASVDAGPLPPAVAERLSSARAEAIVLRGTYRSERLEAALLIERLLLDVKGTDLVPRALAARIETSPEGTVTVRSLSLSGGGVALLAEGRGGAGETAPLSATMRLSADVKRLVPESPAGGQVSLDVAVSGTRKEPAVQVDSATASLEGGGRIAARGRAQLPDGRIEGDLTVADLPARVASAFAKRDVARWLGGDDAVLNGSLKTEWPEGVRGAGTADARLAVRRDDRRLLEGSLKVAGKLGKESPLDVDLVADVFPDDEGRRHVAARVAGVSPLA